MATVPTKSVNQAKTATTAPVAKTGVKPFAVKSEKTDATYYLHTQTCKTPSGERTLFFFSKKIDPARACAAIPTGYTIVENGVTGLPMLRSEARAKAAADAAAAAAKGKAKVPAKK